MAVMERLKMFVVQEPVVAASCLIAGFGLFLPAFVRPMLDSYQATKQPPQPALSDSLVARIARFEGSLLFRASRMGVAYGILKLKTSSYAVLPLKQLTWLQV
ncbi:hypothetical protein GmHk_19G056502 [Glycine max]|nr:hypothetical protein GmHk_19G056502 [Glycine max]